MAPVQEANMDNLEMPFLSSPRYLYVDYTHSNRLDEYTLHTFYNEIRIFP